MKYPNPTSMATTIIIKKLKKPTKKKHKFNGDNHGAVSLDNTGRSIGKQK